MRYHNQRQMASSGVRSKCEIPRCSASKVSLFDPCNETSYYQCGPGRGLHRPCSQGTHFEHQTKSCNHITSISEKAKFWRACNISDNFSTEQCREIWPADLNKWDQAKIKEFLSRTNSTSQQKNNSLLVPLIIISLFMLCLLVGVIILLNYLKKYKRRHPNITKDNDIHPEKEFEDHVYEEIDVNKLETIVPALVVGVEEQYHTLHISHNSPNLKNSLEDRYSTQEAFIDTGNQEGAYNVLDIVGIQQNSKSSGMLPDGYSTLDSIYSEHSDEPTYGSINQ